MGVARIHYRSSNSFLLADDMLLVDAGIHDHRMQLVEDGLHDDRI